jgi:hypothetical protein
MTPPVAIFSTIQNYMYLSSALVQYLLDTACLQFTFSTSSWTSYWVAPGPFNRSYQTVLTPACFQGPIKSETFQIWIMKPREVLHNSSPTLPDYVFHFCWCYIHILYIRRDSILAFSNIFSNSLLSSDGGCDPGLKATLKGKDNHVPT